MRSHDTHRTERIAAQIRRSVSVIIESELDDPRIVGVAVSDVVVTRDLKQATVFVTVVNDDETVLNALRKSAGYIRHIFAEQNSEMRLVPQFRFEIDKTDSTYNRIEAIIKGLHENDGKDK